jgi:hypothetical protein
MRAANPTDAVVTSNTTTTVYPADFINYRVDETHFQYPFPTWMGLFQWLMSFLHVGNDYQVLFLVLSLFSAIMTGSVFDLMPWFDLIPGGNQLFMLYRILRPLAEIVTQKWQQRRQEVAINLPVDSDVEVLEVVYELPWYFEITRPGMELLYGARRLQVYALERFMDAAMASVQLGLNGIRSAGVMVIVVREASWYTDVPSQLCDLVSRDLNHARETIEELTKMIREQTAMLQEQFNIADRLQKQIDDLQMATQDLTGQLQKERSLVEERDNRVESLKESLAEQTQIYEQQAAEYSKRIEGLEQKVERKQAQLEGASEDIAAATEKQQAQAASLRAEQETSERTVAQLKTVRNELASVQDRERSLATELAQVRDESVNREKNLQANLNHANKLATNNRQKYESMLKRQLKTKKPQLTISAISTVETVAVEHPVSAPNQKSSGNATIVPVEEKGNTLVLQSKVLSLDPIKVEAAMGESEKDASNKAQPVTVVKEYEKDGFQYAEMSNGTTQVFLPNSNMWRTVDKPVDPSKSLMTSKYAAASANKSSTKKTLEQATTANDKSPASPQSRSAGTSKVKPAVISGAASKYALPSSTTSPASTVSTIAPASHTKSKQTPATQVPQKSAIQTGVKSKWDTQTSNPTPTVSALSPAAPTGPAAPAAPVAPATDKPEKSAIQTGAKSKWDTQQTTLSPTVAAPSPGTPVPFPTLPAQLESIHDKTEEEKAPKKQRKPAIVPGAKSKYDS